MGREIIWDGKGEKGSIYDKHVGKNVLMKIYCIVL